MGIYKHRQKETGGYADQKWEYINLPDFKARGCGPGFAYFWLWAMLIVSVAVYALDSYTAVNLLILDNWSSKIKPAISIDISKWVFSVCIILSFLNLGWESWRAYRVIKQGNVAASYLDPLAVRWESIRMGQGQGWRRFLVFAELTKSQKGAEYVALFTYFSLQSWIRILICSAPRQVINAFTFVSVYNSQLAVQEATVEDSFTGFFEKIGALYEEDYQQALILGAMAFTFVIWAFGLIFLIAAILCYLFFLIHWIPKSDGGLWGYCERKVSQKLKKIVTQKVNRALAKGQQKQMEADMKAAAKSGGPPPLGRMATLPTLPNIETIPGQNPTPIQEKGDSLPQMPMLHRNETNTSLPAYSSRPSSPGGIEMNKMGRRPMPSRTGTMASTVTDRSYTSKSSLLGSAADMGHGRPASPVPSVPDINSAMLPPSGPGTPASTRTFGAHPGMAHGPSSSNGSTRMMPAGSPAASRGPPNRPMDPYSQQGNSYDNARRHSPPQRQYNAYDPGRASPAPSSNYQRSTPGPYDAYSDSRSSPAPSVSTYHGGHPALQPNPHPMRSATGPVPPRGPPQQPQRNMTAPMPPRGPPQDPYDRTLTPQGMRPPQTPQGFDRSRTPQSQRGGPYGYDVEGQRNNGYGY